MCVCDLYPRDKIDDRRERQQVLRDLVQARQELEREKDEERKEQRRVRLRTGEGWIYMSRPRSHANKRPMETAQHRSHSKLKSMRGSCLARFVP